MAGRSNAGTRHIDSAVEQGDRDGEITWLSIDIRKRMKVHAIGRSHTPSDQQLQLMIDERIAHFRRAVTGC
jgi:hypothetical protein